MLQKETLPVEFDFSQSNPFDEDQPELDAEDAELRAALETLNEADDNSGEDTTGREQNLFDELSAMDFGIISDDFEPLTFEMLERLGCFEMRGGRAYICTAAARWLRDPCEEENGEESSFDDC